jgi:hypothetical protein
LQTRSSGAPDGTDGKQRCSVRPTLNILQIAESGTAVVSVGEQVMDLAG